MKIYKIAAVACALSFLSAPAGADICQSPTKPSIRVNSLPGGQVEFLLCTPSDANHPPSCEGIWTAGKYSFDRAALEAFQKDEDKEASKVNLRQALGALALVIAGPLANNKESVEAFKNSAAAQKTALPSASEAELLRRAEAKDNSEALRNALSQADKKECGVLVDSWFESLKKLRHALYAFTQSPKNKPAKIYGKPATSFVRPAAQTVVERKEPKHVEEPASSSSGWSMPWGNSITKALAN